MTRAMKKCPCGCDGTGGAVHLPSFDLALDEVRTMRHAGLRAPAACGADMVVLGTRDPQVALTVHGFCVVCAIELLKRGRALGVWREVAS